MSDENGRPCHVVAKSEVDDTKQAYRLTFLDGTSIVAGGERHLWDCESIYGKRKAVEWTTGEIYRRTQKCRGIQKQSVIRIPVCGALQTKETELLVDPYLYSYWLGNGHSTKPELTVRTCDVEDVIANIPYQVHNRYLQGCSGSDNVVY